jgi:sigma-B regulation protein RsbU (phosphoserine phosphatase)
MEKKKRKIKTVTSGFAFRMIGGIVLWFFLFTAVVSTIGYIRFTESLTQEYNDSAFRTAETAAVFVNGDKIDEYLAIEKDRNGGAENPFVSEEYAARWEGMNIICQKQNVTLIYVIKVDTSDYGRFESVFNTVNDSSGYSPWSVGYLRNTTNDEYRKVYRDIYENRLERGTVVRTDGLGGREAHVTSLIPIKNSAGIVSAILCVERPMDELVGGRQEYLKNVLLVTVLLTIASAVCLALYIKRHFAKPIEKISAEAMRFAKSPSHAENTAFEKVSEIREIASLAESINKMESDTLRHIEELTVATAEKERMAVELSLAASIQANILPNTFPPYPNRRDFDIFASMDAAKEVGGDFYDFYLLDNDRLVFLVADVSGKGIPAALFMMRAKMTIKSLAETGADVHVILSEANEKLCEKNEAGMFVTAWLGIVDMKSGILSYANAGHNPPLLRSKQGTFDFIRTRPNFILAGMDGAMYRKNEIKLTPGDEIFLYTDGVTEATDAKQELFGEPRLLDALNANPDESVEARCKTVKCEIDKFVGECEQFDDITMLSVKFNAFHNDDSIITNVDSASTERVWDFISQRIKRAEIGAKLAGRAQIIVDEIYSNIQQYSGATMAQVFCNIDPKYMVLKFRDDGIPYDPLTALEPDITASVEKRAIGGLGIHLVKKMATDISYAFEEGHNILTVTMSLDA